MAGKHFDVIEFNEVEFRAKAAGATDAVRKRADAVIAVSKGEDPISVAGRIGAEPTNVLRWVRAFNDGGFEALSEIRVGGATAMRPDYDAEKLRELAADALFPETKNRLLAIAGIYEGMTTARISVDAGVSEAVIGRWRTNFNANGPGIETAANTAVRLEAELAVAARTELKTVADVVEELTGERREKAEAILMSARSMSVARISEALGRPRNWTVSVIRTFNSTGTETLFGIRNHAVPKMSLARPATIDLPKGHTVKSLSDAAREAEGRASRDLYALSKTYLYKNRREAAEASGVSESRIGLLLDRLQKGGIKAVIEQPAYMELDAEKVEQVAEGYKDKKASAKLFALARVIRGESFEAVAADTGGDKVKLRELMNRLVRFGPNGVPDAYQVVAVPEKPKTKTPVAGLSTGVAGKFKSRKNRAEMKASAPQDPATSDVQVTAFSVRIQKAVQAEKPRTSKPRGVSPYFWDVPAAAEPAVTGSAPFVSPDHLEIVRIMAQDADYPGRNLAGAMLHFVDSGDAAEAARRFGVAVTSIGMLAGSLGPTVELYADQRVRKLLDDAGVTPAKVRRMAAKSPLWMSKLRSIGYIAEGGSLRDVSAITGVTPAKLLRWTREISKGWEAAEQQLGNGQAAVRTRVAGMGR
ncbi:hypothetical protein HFO56_02870 [Rhizobium laguerreae]|uniref:helix-turn-helix domain-containing protein n=1 Tax=Rhizobium laguerreae TaxID=1076926 RepID=UPI001C90FDB7|nr:hypothetical protein [Rhizobium laguerreae]MBY3151329.1 hypothetical protein [Rhizobium laguerreae]